MLVLPGLFWTWSEITLLVFSWHGSFILITGDRDPGKRQVKPVQKHLIQTSFGGDDSDDDSDYQVDANGIFLILITKICPCNRSIQRFLKL